jgi:hypothetical protein
MLLTSFFLLSSIGKQQVDQTCRAASQTTRRPVAPTGFHMRKPPRHRRHKRARVSARAKRIPFLRAATRTYMWQCRKLCAQFDLRRKIRAVMAASGRRPGLVVSRGCLRTRRHLWPPRLLSYASHPTTAGTGQTRRTTRRTAPAAQSDRATTLPIRPPRRTAPRRRNSQRPAADTQTLPHRAAKRFLRRRHRRERGSRLHRRHLPNAAPSMVPAYHMLEGVSEEAAGFARVEKVSRAETTPEVYMSNRRKNSSWQTANFFCNQMTLSVYCVFSPSWMLASGVVRPCITLFHYPHRLQYMYALSHF